MNSLNLEKVGFNLIVLFPLLHSILTLITKGDGQAKFFFIYSLLIFQICIRKKFIALFYTKKLNIIVIFALIIEGILFCIFVSSKWESILEFIVFSICIVFWIIYSDKKIFNNFVSWLIKQEKKIICIHILYFMVLSYSIVFREGIDTKGWGTTTLKGPYDMAHVLAYELLIFLLLDFTFYFLTKKILWIILSIICLLLMFVTAVRSVLVATGFVLLYVFFNLKQKNKILVSIAVIIGMLFTYRYTNIFQSLIEKTVFAINNGTITSSRGLIFKTSMEAYLNVEKPLSYFMGIGLEELEKYNLEHIFMYIHAHNDFIDAIVQFGLVGLYIYTYAFYKFLKNVNGIERVFAFLIIFSLSFSNGFFINYAIVICTIIINVFTYVIQNNGNQKNIKIVFNN